MKQNNMRRKLKVVMVVVMVMASLFAVSTAVSARFVEHIFGEENEVILLSSIPGVPQDAWTTLEDIDAGNGSMWSAHPYLNYSEPRLPTDTTYTTHYTSSGGRVVTGADGTAWYSPNHSYSSWIQMR